MTYTNVLSQIPNKITAGNSVSWALSLSEYPASAGWALTYILVNSTNQIKITATANGDNHLVEIPFADSAAYQPGKYSFQARVTNGSERYQIENGTVEIVPDFATKESGYDNRDWLDISIDALEASIAGRASKTQLLQSVSGVQVQHMSLADQITTLNELKKMRSVKRTGNPFNKKVGVRF